ncbi:hypothetical protein TCAL_07209 [Tigriopus californicus]|uniref:Janus A-like protein n=1 Tax=Tigriopus californicus TaxID=6832 RepID=A0A553NQR4_TIGCA|nr:sex-regulated protein janus-A-like [Tigriopus californicus]TRY67788.1 hypothetical protein TCAL_07209 [Tigriopus californicus]|eukprot:TCALIF_07209-PA protein Name:"Similar to janA Sex-regulated protein janus-A (Drosophila yakuba)" AED:0.05 eAED:0.05 QI:0/-1/0/1/-1/1/1/0/127
MVKTAGEKALAALKTVVIDQGVFKYVLIEVTAEDESGQEVTRHLVRGHQSAEYHADIYDPEEEAIRFQGLDAQCLGGGRIQHDPARKYIKVYGYSLGFGRANHARVVEILQTAYPEDYTFEWSDEGY